MENCPSCDKSLNKTIRKEKYKAKTGARLAVNLCVYECKDCDEVYISEDEQRVYQKKCENFAQKVKNKLDKSKVSVH